MRAFDEPVTARILGFFEQIGIWVTLEAVPPPTFFPGVTVRAGGLVIDRDTLAWPGDLLHDAGHIAITEPALRPALDTVSTEPAEEMAALAWSYAAAVALDLDALPTNNPAGYWGEGQWQADALAGGGLIGQPILQLFGMTRYGEHAVAAGVPPYPHMERWLR